MLPLIIAPQPILRQVAQPIPLPLGHEAVTLANEMFRAMVHYRGIGLAAPQVGRSLRLVVAATPGQPTAYLNPEVTKRSWRTLTMEEGCLSLPGVFGEVRRSERVLVRYVTLTGEVRQEELSGLVGRILQHEIDHLDGVLFTDRARTITRGSELLATYGLS